MIEIAPAVKPIFCQTQLPAAVIGILAHPVSLYRKHSLVKNPVKLGIFLVCQMPHSSGYFGLKMGPGCKTSQRALCLSCPSSVKCVPGSLAALLVFACF